ncbi:NRDE family protein [Pseudomonas sp. GOM6]|uniref:NRDE family protein n=1 Tax=Pseudomonas sp. GOM6 TaxID=3036944 RepID=UPI00240A50DA|nr:NRDE family protein [Pseudomonas sp. GOM6]MDG1581241.1 NRDE family protein [Pseudomonas sp. GOM6]
MCLIVFAWRPDHALPLVLAANRDEFYARSSLPLGEWSDMPGLFAGRDLQAGGTWLGVNRKGRFAALTNIRDPHQAQGLHSRGELAVEFLRGERDAETFLAELQPRLGLYSGFNLLLGDRHALYYFNSKEGQARRLQAGLYGLSNAELDTPWPKVLRASEKLAAALNTPQPEQLLALMRDRQQPPRSLLPDTGIGLDWEQLLSSMFIVGPGYGTCSSNALLLDSGGGVTLVEQRYDTQGQIAGESAIQLPAPAT